MGEVLDTETSVPQLATSQKFDGERAHGLITFTDVEFRYPGAQDPVLKKVNFTAKPGQTTAFIGSTGSGKTTLINLIPRLFDVTSGTVSIDGIDIRNLDLLDLWSSLALVP